MLQTATADVVRPDKESRPLNLRLVFDSCSQRSYVTQSVKDKLDLLVLGKDSLLIKALENQMPGYEHVKLFKWVSKPYVMQLCIFKLM